MNAYIHTLPASSSCNLFHTPAQPPLDTITENYYLYSTNVPTALPVYHMNPNLPYPFSPILNSNEQLSQNHYNPATSLPTITHIPLLTGQSDWGPWYAAVGNHIVNLSLTSHVCDDPKAGDPFNPGHIPTHPPVITTLSTQPELTVWDAWWWNDGIAGHILTS